MTRRTHALIILANLLFLSTTGLLTVSTPVVATYCYDYGSEYWASRDYECVFVCAPDDKVTVSVTASESVAYLSGSATCGGAHASCTENDASSCYDDDYADIADDGDCWGTANDPGSWYNFNVNCNAQGSYSSAEEAMHRYVLDPLGPKTSPDESACALLGSGPVTGKHVSMFAIVDAQADVEAYGVHLGPTGCFEFTPDVEFDEAGITLFAPPGLF